MVIFSKKLFSKIKPYSQVHKYSDTFYKVWKAKQCYMYNIIVVKLCKWLMFLKTLTKEMLISYIKTMFIKVYHGTKNPEAGPCICH